MKSKPIIEELPEDALDREHWEDDGGQGSAAECERVGEAVPLITHQVRNEPLSRFVIKPAG